MPARSARNHPPPATSTNEMTIEQRSRLRRQRIRSHRARDFADAERWDLRFWQSLTPEDRLSALIAIREDVRLVQAARRKRVK